MAVPCAAPMPAPKSILIVDAERENLERLRETLAVERYRVHTTISTRDAMRIIKRESIDVVVSEIDVLGASGLDFMVGIRRAHPDVMRIVMSARPSVDVMLRAINEAGVRHFLTKPCEPDQLRIVLRELLAAETERTIAPRDERHDLTPRLLETLEIAMTGASEKQIADLLGISPHTAHQYLQALFRRFGVTSRAQLMARVLRR